MSNYMSDLPVRPEQLEATGMVAVEWSYLESVMDAAIWNLAQMPSEDVGEAITTHLPFRGRLDMLATLFDLDGEKRLKWRSHAEDEVKHRRAEFKAIRQSIESLSKRRNEVLHARWVRGDLGSPQIYGVDARGTLKRTKRGMSDAEIRGLAQEIADQSGKLRSFFEIETA